jgi:hypothetical protein
MGLGRNLSTGESNDPQQAAAWSKSEEGKDFIRQSGDEWSKASIASGTDAAAALSAADRTLAFYTGDARI